MLIHILVIFGDGIGYNEWHSYRRLIREVAVNIDYINNKNIGSCYSAIQSIYTLWFVAKCVNGNSCFSCTNWPVTLLHRCVPLPSMIAGHRSLCCLIRASETFLQSHYNHIQNRSFLFWTDLRVRLTRQTFC